MASIKISLLLTLALAPSLSLAGETVKVLPGETLMTFSNRVFGTHQKWREILKWKKEIIKDANRIEPGLALTVHGAGPKAVVAVRHTEPQLQPGPQRKPQKSRSISSQGARVIYQATERPAAVPVVEEVDTAPDRGEEHVAPAESAHTPAGRAAIFPGVQHPDPDSEPLAPFSSLEVPK